MTDKHGEPRDGRLGIVGGQGYCRESFHIAHRSCPKGIGAIMSVGTGLMDVDS